MSNLKKCFLLATCLISITCKQNVVAPANLLSDPSIMPSVIYTYPQANSTGPYENFSTSITVRFNKLMDLTSLQHAVRFSSLLGDIKEDTGSVYSQTGEVASISPVFANPTARFLWKIGQRYSLRIENTARDVNGNNLIPPFSMTIRPEPYFRVKNVSPASGNSTVSLGTPIQLYFNSFVDTTIFSSITISPALAGTWRFSNYYGPGIDSSSIYFQPQGGALRAATTYSISVGRGAHDKSGYTMPDAFSSSFKTVDFQVYYTRPLNGDTTVSPFAAVQVYFDAAIDTASVRGAFQIIPTVEGLLGYEGSVSSFTFSPILTFVEGTKYTVTIGSTMLSKGGTPIASPYVFSFTIAPFKIQWTEPLDGTTHVPRSAPIGMYTNDVIDTASIRSAFSVSPPVSGTFRLNPPFAAFYFQPDSLLQPSTIYSVTISNSLRSQSGSNLRSPYRFSFATGN